MDVTIVGSRPEGLTGAVICACGGVAEAKVDFVPSDDIPWSAARLKHEPSGSTVDQTDRKVLKRDCGITAMPTMTP